MATAIGTLLRALETLTVEIDRDLPITSALVFLAVARTGTEGCDQGRVMEELQLSSAGISRTVQTLGRTHYLKGKAGLDLVERQFDPTDNRRRVLRLTPKGTRLMRALVKQMED